MNADGSKSFKNGEKYLRTSHNVHLIRNVWLHCKLTKLKPTMNTIANHFKVTDMVSDCSEAKKILQ